MASTTSKACGKSVEMLYELGFANTPVLVFMSEETEQMPMMRFIHFTPKGIAGCQEQHMGEVNLCTLFPEFCERLERRLPPTTMYLPLSDGNHKRV